MPLSVRQRAKRAFVAVLLEVARLYAVPTAVNRDSPDAQVLAAYRKVILKAHPDKGGATAPFQKLQGAKEEWVGACPAPPGRPRNDPEGSAAPVLAPDESFDGLNSVYHIRSLGILLTYQNAPGPTGWPRFCAWVRRQLKPWGVRYWCASMEKCRDGRDHVHVMLQFKKAQQNGRHVDQFKYQASRPNASTRDLNGEGPCGKKLQQSLDRGFFYVFADKIGTARTASGQPCTDANYFPAWLDADFRYQVLGKWPEALWKQYKITDGV